MADIESERLRRALSTIDLLSDATLLRHEFLLSKLTRRWDRCKKRTLPRPKAPTRLEQLETCLINLRTKTLEPFVQQSYKQAVGEQVDLQQDTRVNDILLATAPSPEQQGRYKFRKGLAKRSLAVQYNEWQQRLPNEQSRVQDLAEDYSRASEKESGRIRQFLTSCGLLYENRVIDGVKQGTQLLVFEKKMRTTGSSALLFFCMGYFSKIRYSGFDSLAAVFERNTWMMTTAKTASTWFDQCTTLYEAQRRSTASKRHTISKGLGDALVDNQDLRDDCWPAQLSATDPQASNTDPARFNNAVQGNASLQNLPTNALVGMNSQLFQSPFNTDYSSLLEQARSCPQGQSLPLVSAFSADFTSDLLALQSLLEQPLEASGTVATLGNHPSLESVPILPHQEIYPVQP